MFIKTPSPFPPGTLLKFEVRISGDQRVMQGVGRVVWKREAGEVQDGAPAGMGVKFIKIDDASRSVIDQLVTRSGGAISAFERGGSDSATATPIAAPAAAKADAATAPTIRKATMIGLGAMGADAAEAAKALSEPAQGFFPEGKDGVEEPAPEDRTVMKQAAELLQDALREAGGSLDDTGTPTAPDTKVASSTPPPQPVSAPPRPAAHRSDAPASHKEPEPKKEIPADAVATPRPSDRRPVAAAVTAATRPGPASAKSMGPKSTAPTSARRVSIPSEDGREGAEGSGMGRIAVLAIAIAAIGGAIFVLTRSPAEEAAPPPPAPAEVKPEPQPEPPPPATAEPAPSAEAAPTPSAAAAATEATPPASAAPEPSAKSKALVEPKPVAEPKPTAAPKPAPAPKPVAAPKPPAEPKPAPEPKPPVEATPAEPKPTATPKPAAEAKPKPAPKAPDTDNPY
jgi:hypothetical protein